MTDLEEKGEGNQEAPKTFGSWLKNQRLQKKVPLEEIAAVTKVHLHQLKCLEEGWVENLPAMTIIRGITVSYVKHLGLDESEVMEKFKQHQGEFKEKASPLIKSHTPTTYTPSSGKPLRFGSYSERKEQSQLAHWLSTKRTLYAVLVIAAFGLIILLMNLGKKASQEVSLDAPTVVETGNVNAPLPQPQPQETKIVDQKASEGSALFAGNPPYDFTIKAEGDVWFNMQIDDQSLISFKLSAGQERKIAFNRRARVTFSNPLLTKFQISGATYKSTAPLGKDETLIFPDQSNKLVQAN